MVSIRRTYIKGCRYVALLAALAVASVACGGSDPSPTSTPVQHAPEVQRAIDDLEGKVGFRSYAPTYLPDGMDTTPETAHVRDETQQTAIIAFFPLEGNEASPAPPAVVEVTEEPAKDFVCPLCPGSGFTQLELGGEEALSEEGVIAEETPAVVYYVLYFNVGDIFVVLNGEWNVPDGADLTGPTDEMKQELVRVAESMLVQA